MLIDLSQRELNNYRQFYNITMILKCHIWLIVISFCLLATPTNAQDDDYMFALINMRVEVKQHNSQVIWKVHKEQLGHVYIIEKSTDKENWVEKARVPSVEPDSIILDYNHAIPDRVEGTVEYYRLKRLSPDGYEDILRTYSVFHKVLSNMKITSPPGQSNKLVTIEYKALLEVPVKITVETMEGDVVYESREETVNGENWHTIKLKKIKPGRYLVVIRDNNENKVQKALQVY